MANSPKVVSSIGGDRSEMRDGGWLSLELWRRCVHTVVVLRRRFLLLWQRCDLLVLNFRSGGSVAACSSAVMVS
jgi:hypothetical protein